MIEAQETTSGAEGRLPRARAEFVATLGRRLTALANTLHQLEENPASRERRNMLLRRVHALGSAAKVLGFDGVAEALAEAERALARSAGGGPVSSTDLAEVSRALDLLPSIAWGAKVAPRAVAEPEEDVALVSMGWPLSILVYGPAALRSALVSSDDDQQVECELAEDAEAFRELAQRVGPDLAVVDGDMRGARELIENLLHDALIEPFPVIVVGTFDGPEAASSFVSLGAARVLPKPVGPEALAHAVVEASQHESSLRGPREPIGDVTVGDLANRIAAELRRGLVDGVEHGAEGVSIPLGEGIDVLAAVWGAVARVREVLTMRSGGRVRFRAGGPEGAVPLAPWTGSDRRAGERGSSSRRTDGVRLEGRRAVVVDDDPAVVWFLSGLLKTSGVEVAEAHDGLRARELVFQGMPDLIVSDVLMPGIDGFSLCREIKRDLAVRDVPVILLSWKEDLLQRVRELGAGADGYLRKEAAASTVLSRVREVLRPRARVESRLQSGGEVRGRLDGLTPRLLLELVERYQPDSRVVIRDSVFLYELEMRDGRPRCVTRTAMDGGFERGAGVLDALVGVAAGRFVVTPNSGSCRDDLQASLRDLLAPRIRRARGLLEVMHERELGRIDFVEIDSDSVGAYLQATPEPARSLFESLLRGVGPREILEKDPSHQALLSAVLSDVVRRGAVKSVVRDGREVDLAELQQPSLPPPEASSAEAESAPLFTLDLSPAPPEVADAMARWEQPEPGSESSARLPLNRAVTPLPPAGETAPPSSEGFRDEPHTAPGVGPVMFAAAIPGEPSESESAASGLPGEASELPGEASELPGEASESESAAHESETAASESPGEASESENPASESPGEARESESATSESESEASEVMSSTQARQPTAASEAPTQTPPPAFAAPESRTPATLRVSDAGLEPEAEATDEQERDSQPSPAGASVVALTAQRDDDASADEDDTDDSPSEESEPARRRTARSDDPPARGAPDFALPEARKIEFPRARAAQSKIESGTRRETKAASRLTSEPAAAKPSPAKEGMSPVVIGLMVAAAAALSFGVVTVVRGFGAEAEPQSAVDAPPALVQSAAPTPVVVQAKPSAVQPNSEELALPPGVPLSSGKGLLEIDIGEKHAIYVDGTFVGRGPTRRVPLDPGQHDVVLKTPNGELSLQAEVKTSRRTRVSLPTAAP